jgi:predicted DNA-binding protein
MGDRKDSAIQFRLPRELHKKFMAICEKESLSAAQWLRKQVEMRVKEEEK